MTEDRKEFVVDFPASPPEMTPLERSRLAALNVRLWCDWLLDGTGPSPVKGVLTDASGDEENP